MAAAEEGNYEEETGKVYNPETGGEEKVTVNYDEPLGKATSYTTAVEVPEEVRRNGGS